MFQTTNQFLSHWTPPYRMKKSLGHPMPDSGQRPSPQGWSHQRWRFRSATPWATVHPALGHGSQTPPPRRFRTSNGEAEGWQGSIGYNQIPPKKDAMFTCFYFFWWIYTRGRLWGYYGIYIYIYKSQCVIYGFAQKWETYLK